ncbi:MAG TPA: NEW3 domain-containing protein [Actinomycetales bacterium]
MHGLTITSTDLYVGTEQRPLQVLRVGVQGVIGTAGITVTGPGVSGAATTSGPMAEVGLAVEAAFGAVVPVQVEVVDDEGHLRGVGELTVAEPGWTMHLVSHFHYDPVWWNTQAAYARTWDELPDDAQQYRMGWQQPGFALIDTHLDLARRDPDYKFVLAEVDLVKPFWDARPDRRAYLRQLVAEGRLELMGGTYNEPNTNLTSAEVTIRNFVYGAGFQRDVMGADPSTAWQLDAFGHDPQFPGLAADAGVTSSSWARGPFRPWGPMLKAFLPGPEGWGDPRSIQFPSEFEWIAPSGRGVLTHYMPAHYSAGWVMDEATSLTEAESALHELFSALKTVAATRNVLLPVGTDYTPPNRWLTDVHRHWNATYVWPRFVCALPREFFGAVRAELEAEGRTLTAQSRDMNPVFTGKEVSFIDTKQAHRAAETALVDAEKLAVFARAHGAAYPHAAFDKAWRHLLFGAHHDAVTGSESDQVYLDLLTTWHEALDLVTSSLETSMAHLCALLPGDGGQHVMTVFNPSSWTRTDLVEQRVELPSGALQELGVESDQGRPVPAVVEVLQRHADGSVAVASVGFVATDVPALGYRSWRLVPAAAGTGTGWVTRRPGPASISSQRYLLEVDGSRGGGVSALLDRLEDRQLIAAGEVGNVLLRTLEYAEHPSFNEGPWHLLPTGQTLSSAEAPATAVVVQDSPAGQRIEVEGVLDGVRYVQRLTLWQGLDRVDCRTWLHGYEGADQLFRVQWPAAIAGAMPVSEVGDAVIGRGHALIEADSADHPWTLDNPAYGFVALSSTARVVVTARDGTRTTRAIGTAEIVTPPRPSGGQQDALRELAVALARSGVTATTSVGAGPRYGTLAVDSNLPDVRISVGAPQDNVFSEQVLATAPEHAAELDRQLRENGCARVWVPASRPLVHVWVPSADLRGVRDLPVLLVVGDDEVAALADDLRDAVIDVAQGVQAGDGGPDLDDFTFGLLNRGTPGFAVDTRGRLHLSLMRSCTGWPSGVWIDPPRRRAPDGSAFQQQHWSHRFDHAVASGAGDWRSSGLVASAHDFNHPLRAHVHVPQGTGLPAQQSFLRIEGAGEVVVTAVKAGGNAIADGLVPADDDAVTVRFHEARGRSAQVRLIASAGLSAAHRLDLLERPAAHLPPVDEVAGTALSPGEIVTVGAVLQRRQTAAGECAPSFVEPVQPVYSRYWLNNTGTAPAGNVAVAVHVESDHVRAAAGDRVPVAVTVASSLTAAASGGEVVLRPPPGWAVEPAARPYVLGPGAHLRWQPTLVVPADAAAGCYLVAAEVEHDGQRVHDLVRVLVGGAEAEQVGAELLSTGVRLVPGTPGSLTVRLTSDAATAVPAQVQLITPWDLWLMTDGWNTGALVPAGGKVEIVLPFRPPLDAEPGRWWAIVKVAAVGRVQFTQAVEVVVGHGGPAHR